jgi:hypothetical protein
MIYLKKLLIWQQTTITYSVTAIFLYDMIQSSKIFPFHDYPRTDVSGGMVFNATFNTISVISWRSVLLVEETIVPGEQHRPGVSHWQTLSRNIVSSTPRYEPVDLLR